MSKFNSTKYKNDFNKEAYDRASINFPKGQKAIIEQHWRSKGYKSLNSYINDLIAKDMHPEEAATSIQVQNNNGVIMRDNHGTVKL